MPANGEYTDEEVRKILDRALRGEPDRGVSHDELVAIASEVGVSRESIDAAARALHLERESARGRELVIRRRRGRLVSHAFAFALVNAFLFAINYLTTPGQWWFLFPVFSWGLALLFHARFALSREVSARALLKEQRRAAHAERYDDLAERMELAALAELSPRSTNPDSPARRTRIDATPAASESDAGLESQAELGAPTAGVGRRRE
jgi:2TM domain